MLNDPNAFTGLGGVPPPMNNLGTSGILGGMGGFGAHAMGGGMSQYGNDTIGGMMGMNGGGGYGADSGMGMMGGGYGRGRGGYGGPPRGRGRGRGGDFGGGGYGSSFGNGNPYATMGPDPTDPTDVRNRCNFFHKMGACRHADNCTKYHIRPTNGQTVLFPKMYTNPLALEYLTDREWNFQFEPKFLDKYFNTFYKNIWRTLMKLGRIVELRVVSNLCEHLVGNVYVRFADPAKAAYVCESLRHRKYNDVLLLPEMTPVNDFDEACCKEDRDAGNCDRKYQCNFLHLLKVSREVMEQLGKEQDEYWEGREKLEREEAEKERARAERKAKEKEQKEKERKAKEKSEKDQRKVSSSTNRDRDEGGKRHSSGGSGSRGDRGGRSSRRDGSRDRRRDRSRSRSRGGRDRDYSKDRSYRDRERRSKRDRSPVGGGSADDHRLCMVCGKKGHISKDCSLKV